MASLLIATTYLILLDNKLEQMRCLMKVLKNGVECTVYIAKNSVWRVACGVWRLA